MTAILGDPLVVSDRGTLHPATGEGGRRFLLRVIEGRDIDFRRELDRLRRSLAEAHAVPKVLPIVDHNFQGGSHYYVEYALPGTHVESLGELFRREHWLANLRLVRESIRAWESWRHLVTPVGFHAGGIVACRVGGTWVPHMAPCPVIRGVMPYDLRKAGPDALAGIAPERLRGRDGEGRFEDVFGAGSLVALALGVKPLRSGINPDQNLELQAKGACVNWTIPETNVEKEILSIASVRRIFEDLRTAALRCSAFDPTARPPDLDDLKKKLDRVIDLGAGDDVRLGGAGDLLPADALKLVEWALAINIVRGERMRDARRVAADLARILKLASHELEHLSHLADDEAARQRMIEVRYEAYIAQPPIPAGDADPEGDQLLATLRKAIPPRNRGLDSDERRDAREVRLQCARIYARRGDAPARAQELLEAVELDFQDIDALYMYVSAFRELNPRSARIDTWTAEARDRLASLREAGILDDSEIKAWTELFQLLRRR